MKSIVAILFASISIAFAQAPFTNIVLPGTWPAETWWTNASPPASIVASNAWLAFNENMLRASNAMQFLTSYADTKTNLAALTGMGLLTENQPIVLTGDATGTVTTGGAVTVTNILASTGSAGQLLTKTSTGNAWSNAPAGGGDVTQAGQNNFTGSNNFSGPVVFNNSAAGSNVLGLTYFTGAVFGGTNIVHKVVTQVITAGTTTYTPTAGMQWCLVICVGGGGGTAATTAADDAQSGGGGGGCAIKLFTAATIGASQTCVVGATSTTTGNTSGLGTANALLQATGGAAGAAHGNATTAIVAGGAGGVGTLGDINMNGGAGGPGITISTAVGVGGTGGCSIFGGGGKGTGSTAQGTAGTAYGGGAGGGHTSDGTDLGAIAGAAGVIYVIEFL